MENKAANLPPECTPPLVDRAIAALAGRQFGVISLAQLVSLGLSPRAVRDRVAAGRMYRLHRGVYAVGHPRVEKKGRMLAAVLSCPAGALLSHRSAGELHGLRPWSGYPEVTVPRRKVRERKGLILHRCRGLRPEDTGTIEGISCTGLHRTIVDLCDVLPKQAMERVLERAEQLNVLDIRRLRSERWPGRRTDLIAELLGAHDPRRAKSRNELERAFFDLCKHASLPLPAVNVWLPELNAEADFLWREQRVIVETDGWQTHGTRKAFESDRNRDQRMAAAGWRTVRCTWRQVLAREPDLIAALESVLKPSSAALRA